LEKIFAHHLSDKGIVTRTLRKKYLEKNEHRIYTNISPKIYKWPVSS
jgi:hypothetical protein